MLAGPGKVLDCLCPSDLADLAKVSLMVHVSKY